MATSHELPPPRKGIHSRRDALAAERRQLPNAKLEKRYTFDSSGGPVRPAGLCRGPAQLLLYFMFAPSVNGWPNAGCPGLLHVR